MEFETLKPTRQQYLNGEVTFDEYYLALAKECGISYEASELLPAVRLAILDGDLLLNSIPLAEWESRARGTRKISEFVFKQHGDNWNLASAVCMHKAAATDAANRKESK